MKAILILDEKPKMCDYDCPCYNNDNVPMCHATNKTILDDETTPEWCPLIEINDNIAKLIEVAR